MSWMQNLYETYNACANNENIPDSINLYPIGWSTQNAHIEIVLSKDGNFISANFVDKKDAKTLIPVTEDSARRSSGIAPHPLCDTLQYIAGDLIEYTQQKSSKEDKKKTEKKISYYDDFFLQLEQWQKSSSSHQKTTAVYNYVAKKSVIKDLISYKLLAIEHNKLVIRTKDENIDVKNEPYEIFKLMQFDNKGIKSQSKIFVRWIIYAGECVNTWKDVSLYEKWKEYYFSQNDKIDFCSISGQKTVIAAKHPARIRSSGDKATIISSNDTSNYTYLGRFLNADQAVMISAEITQKTHSALRWLIERKQAFKNESQVFVAWAQTGIEIPSVIDNTFDFLEEQEIDEPVVYKGDAGQNYALRLVKKISGYKTNINDAQNIYFMGVDSAVPGRLSVTYYREFKCSEYFDRIEKWHADFAWYQNFGKHKQFTGAPSPRDIAEAVQKGKGKANKKLVAATVERLIPCIIDGTEFPKDIVDSCVRRASNPVSFVKSGKGFLKKRWEWEKLLGIACAIYKGKNINRGYEMALEENRTTRDYLYGRLLAVAEKIESHALSISKESRDTTAERLMQRFSDRPFSTWRHIETALRPYQSRLRNRALGSLLGYKELLDTIHVLFLENEFEQDDALSGEYLLGYHCQRRWFELHNRKNGQWVEKTDEELKSKNIQDEEDEETIQEGN